MWTQSSLPNIWNRSGPNHSAKYTLHLDLYQRKEQNNSSHPLQVLRGRIAITFIYSDTYQSYYNSINASPFLIFPASTTSTETQSPQQPKRILPKYRALYSFLCTSRPWVPSLVAARCNAKSTTLGHPEEGDWAELPDPISEGWKQAYWFQTSGKRWMQLLDLDGVQ